LTVAQSDLIESVLKRAIRIVTPDAEEVLQKVQ